MTVGPVAGRRIDWVVVGAVAAAVLWALWLIRAIWGEGLPVGSDMGAHFVRAEVAQDQFFRHGLLDGWQARFGVGYQQSLFLGPGFSLVAISLRLATFGLISVEVAVKATMVISYALAPVALATLAWAFGLGRRAIAVAALLSFGVTCTLGGAGLAGIFVWSLAPHALAAAFVLFAAAGMVRVLRRPSLLGVAATAASTGAVVVTHPWSALVAVVFALCLVLSAGVEWTLRHGRSLTSRDGRGAAWRRGSRSVGALAIALAWGAALGAVQLVPSLVHRDLKGPDEPFGDFPILERVQAALRGEDLLRPYVAIVVAAGMLYLAGRAVRGQRGALTLLLTPVALVVGARAARTRWPDTLYAVQLTNRALFLVGFLAVLPAAALIGDGGGALVDRGIARRRASRGGSQPATAGRGPGATVAARLPARLAAVASWVAVLGVAFVLIAVPTPPAAERAEVARPTPALLRAAEQIRGRVTPTGRYAVQLSRRFDGERTGVWFPDFWLNWSTGRNSLNSYNIESALAGEPIREVRRFADRDADDEADRLARYGVTHVLLVEPEAVGRLLSSPRFPVVWSEGGMALAEVRRADATMAPVPLVSAPTPVQGEVLDGDPQHLHLRLDNPVEQRIGLGTGWSPKWHLSVDGRPAPLDQDEEHVMTAVLPAGTHTVRLDFERDGADLVGTAVSLAAAAGLLVAIGVDGRRRRVARARPEATATGDQGPPPSGRAGPDRDRVDDFEAVGAEP